ncbi:MAG: hypothetical protein WC651_03325 [Candidatus Gracilibacteria bacterium]|jgi:hypothetical protein
MAWTNPTTWTVGQTVTAADLNQQVRDNFLTVLGTCGYLGTATSSYGAQPISGAFAGARLQNWHIESGTFLLTTATASATGTDVAYGRSYAATPMVVLTQLSTRELDWPRLLSVTATCFVAIAWGSTNDFTCHFFAFGSDT